MKDLDWSNLSFGYRQTDYNVRCYYRDGKWGEIEVCSDEYLKLHMAATCLHYGQEAFEGLKAYRCPDGKVRVFRVMIFLPARVLMEGEPSTVAPNVRMMLERYGFCCMVIFT